MGQKMEDGALQISLKWLEGLSKGIISHDLEELTLKGLQILQGQKGFIRCNFVVPSRASVNRSDLSILIILHSSSVLAKGKRK